MENDMNMGLSTMTEKNRQIGLKLPPDLIEWLEAQAHAADRPLAYVARKILAERKEAEEGAKSQSRVRAASRPAAVP